MRSWPFLVSVTLMLFLAAPAWGHPDEEEDSKKEEAPDVGGGATPPPIEVDVHVEVHNDSHNNNENEDSNNNSNNQTEETTTESASPDFVDPRSRDSVFDRPATSSEQETDSREVEVRVKAPERRDDPPPSSNTDRKSVFDDPPTTTTSPSPGPGPSTSTGTPIVRKRRRVDVWPLTLGFKLGAATANDEFNNDWDSDSAFEDEATYTLWVGYRHRPFHDPLGPFVSAGLEFTAMGAPFEYDRIGVISPTLRVGFDWVPYSSPLPVSSVYAIAGYVAGPGFDHGTRLGFGVSFLPLIVCGAPTTLEITNEAYSRDDDVINTVHLQIGWMF